MATASSGSWFASYAIPTAPASSLQTYTFSSMPLEAQIFTHPSFQQPFGAPAQHDNALLSWLGSTLAQTLSALQISALFPNLTTGAASDLRMALTSKPLHAHLSRLLTLPPRLKSASPPSEKVLADLFDAYLAGISRDLGLARFDDLYRWYFTLLEPYAVAYHQLYASHTLAPPPRRQELAAYTSRLMEYAAKNKLDPPRFEFVSNGAQGADITWSCCVVLGGNRVSTGTASSKAEAKHSASMMAMRALPAQGADPLGGQQRRKRKELFRSKAAMGKGGMMGGVGAGLGSHSQIGPHMPIQMMQLPMFPPPPPGAV